MNKLTKAQRDQLTGVAVGAVALVAVLWYFVVLPKQEALKDMRKKTADKQLELQDAEALIRKESEIGGELHQRSQLLRKEEGDLADERDPYAWLITTMNAFIQQRKGVNIDSFGGQPEISDTGLIPRFPYRWATFHLRGTGYYNDLGKLFADFEKNFRYFRIQNPTLSVMGAGADAEKLNVTFELVAPLAGSAPEIK